MSNTLKEMIRVNQAGEFGATRIYKGQLWALTKFNKNNIDDQELFTHMLDQEKEHLRLFNEMIIKDKVRPTALQPLWSLIGFGLGAASVIAGRSASMALTVSIEDVIDKHYTKQMQELKSTNKKETSLYKLIHQCWQEEVEHKNIALENDAQKAPFYRPISKMVKLGANLAIALSKKI